MQLEPGTKLGTFEITGLLGKGGMGEVYRAHDSKLGRDVAIKVLPRELADDAEGLERFKREAKLVASLDHPNICTVYEIGREGDTRFIVMQLVEGETLAVRIDKSALPTKEALPIFIQIAEALDVAHEKGIVHRDLKPGNIMLDNTGKVRILDFGIAKDTTGSIASEEDSTSNFFERTQWNTTEEGEIVGTPAFMSPEQARGRTVDKRTDIWAFGCCLFAALTGKKPFHGETAPDTLAHILEREPDWLALPPNVPSSIETIVRRCLEKDSRKRLSSAGDIAITLEEAHEVLKRNSGRMSGVTLGAPLEKARTGRFSGIHVAIVGVLCSLVAVGATLLLATPGGDDPTVSLIEEITALNAAREPKPLVRFPIPLDPSEASFGNGIALSPDGTLLVYTAGKGEERHLVLRRMDQLGTQVLPYTDGADYPIFSPDGEWIAFRDNIEQKFKKISLRGGAPVTLMDYDGGPPFLSWGDDGYIVFSTSASLGRVAEAGGDTEKLTSLRDGELFHVHPHVLPGARFILFSVVKSLTPDGMSIAAYSYESGEITDILEDAWNAIYTPTGHLVYGVHRGLMAAPFDVDTLEFTGPAVPVGERGLIEMDPGGFPTNFAISASGSFAHVVDSEGGITNTGPPRIQRALVWVDRQGNETPVDAPAIAYRTPRLSPDGRYLAVAITEYETFNTDIWIYDLERTTRTRLTFDPAMDLSPIWTPDGKRVVFSSMRDGVFNLYSKAADGTGSAERLTTSNSLQSPRDWTPDGKSLVLRETTVGLARGDLAVFSPETGEEPRKLLETPFDERDPRLSPDGRWIAYSSDSSNQRQVIVQSFPEMEGKWQVSTDGGENPLWSPDGSELFYRNGATVMAVPVDTSGAFSPGIPKLLFEGDYVGGYDIAPDGERFLMMKPVETEDEREPAQGSTEIVVVLNWLESLKRLAPIPEANR